MCKCGGEFQKYPISMKPRRCQKTVPSSPDCHLAHDHVIKWVNIFEEIVAALITCFSMLQNLTSTLHTTAWLFISQPVSCLLAGTKLGRSCCLLQRKTTVKKISQTLPHWQFYITSPTSPLISLYKVVSDMTIVWPLKFQPAWFVF